MAALTMLFGGIGAVAHWDIRNILAYNVIIGVGFIVSGVAIFTPASLIGATYYFIHDMVMKALLFLLGGTVIRIVGSNKLKEMGGLIRNHTYWADVFYIALSLAGFPSKWFIGKILIIQEGLAVVQPGLIFWLAQSVYYPA